MKYKVILYNQYSASDTDLSGVLDFYTKFDAENCVNHWIGANPNFQAYLWDGVTWTLYS